jgi:hypothetical protein
MFIDKITYKIFLTWCFLKQSEKRLLASFIRSHVCLYALNNSTPMEQICVKFYTEGFYYE